MRVKVAAIQTYDVYIVAGANCPVTGNPDKGYASEILVGPKGLVGRYNRTIPKGLIFC